MYFFGQADFKVGEQFNGGGFRTIPGEEEWGAIRALKPTTGEVAWEHRLFSPPYAGVLSTGGNLVFGATNEGQIFALQASTGKLLWKFQGGGAVRSNPMSYLSEGKQQVAMALGNSLYVFHVQ